MYGSSRLGVKEYYPNQYRYEQNTAKTASQNQASLDSSTTSYRMPWYSHYYNSMIVYDKTTPFGNGNPYPFWSTHIIGQKRYELSNHLGNVMAVVSDKVVETGTSTRAALRAAYDYYPFGMQMPMRSVEDGSIHCVPVSRTRYENVRVPLSPTGISGIFATATKLPFSGGSTVVRIETVGNSFHKKSFEHRFFYDHFDHLCGMAKRTAFCLGFHTSKLK